MIRFHDQARAAAAGLSKITASAALGVALLAGAMSLPGHAQEPELIFKKSTVWKMLTPDDKLATYALDDPGVDGVTCYYTAPERGGVKGMLGVAEEVSDISLACRQTGPIRIKEKFEQGEVMFREFAVADLQEDAGRARLRRQAQRPRLYGLFGPDHRGLAEELDVLGAADAMGRIGRAAQMRRLSEKLIRKRGRAPCPAASSLRF